MPHYHFHLRTPGGIERDDDGLAFADLDAAYLEACRAIPEFAVDLIAARRDPMACAFVIADAEDRPLLEVSFRERVRDARTPPPIPDAPRPAASCAIERAHGLVADVRAQHARLQDNLNRMRDLLLITRSEPGASRP